MTREKCQNQNGSSSKAHADLVAIDHIAFSNKLIIFALLWRARVASERAVNGSEKSGAHRLKNELEYFDVGAIELRRSDQYLRLSESFNGKTHI